MLYAKNQDSLKRILFTDVGKMLAKYMFLGYFNRPRQDRARKRRKEYYKVELENGTIESAVLAIGHQTPQNTIKAHIWIDSDWKLRYGSFKNPLEIWEKIQIEILGYRRRLIKGDTI